MGGVPIIMCIPVAVAFPKILALKRKTCHAYKAEVHDLGISPTRKRSGVAHVTIGASCHPVTCSRIATFCSPRGALLFVGHLTGATKRSRVTSEKPPLRLDGNAANS